MDEVFINKFLENLKENEIDDEFIKSIEELIKNNELSEKHLINLIEGAFDG